MKTTERGSALLLATLVIVALLTLGSVVWLRLQTADQRRPPQHRRLQTIWLARSAALTGATGSNFEVAGEAASVSSTGSSVSVQWGGASATIDLPARSPRAGGLD